MTGKRADQTVIRSSMAELLDSRHCRAVVVVEVTATMLDLGRGAHLAGEPPLGSTVTRGAVARLGLCVIGWGWTAGEIFPRREPPHPAPPCPAQVEATVPDIFRNRQHPDRPRGYWGGVSTCGA